MHNYVTRTLCQRALWELTALPRLQNEFNEPFRGDAKRDKGKGDRKGGEKEGRKRKKWGKTPTPRNKFLVTTLAFHIVCFVVQARKMILNGFIVSRIITRNTLPSFKGSNIGSMEHDSIINSMQRKPRRNRPLSSAFTVYHVCLWHIVCRINYRCRLQPTSSGLIGFLSLSLGL